MHAVNLALPPGQTTLGVSFLAGPHCRRLRGFIARRPGTMSKGHHEQAAHDTHVTDGIIFIAAHHIERAAQIRGEKHGQIQ